MKRITAIILSLLLVMSLSAQGTSFREGLFRYAPFGHSLLADMHPDFVRLDMQWNTNHHSYDWGHTGDSYRFTTAAVFGMKLPLWRGNIHSDAYALAVSIPLSASLWLDLTEPTTSPVIDTDYRIGGPIICFMHRLNKGFAKNYSISWDPFKHESTHIGDELVLQHADLGFPLRRVNVSYNYTELNFTLNEAEDRYAQNHCFRVGLLLLWNARRGWYFIDATDGEASLAQPKVSPWEMYLQYQYQSPTSKHGFQGVASVEVRNRAALGYPDYAVDSEGQLIATEHTERRAFTYNVFLGARFNMPHYDGYFSRFAMGVRLYHGICPWGQFRNITDYNQAGLCLIFE